MKIALVTLDYPPERGGVARYLGNLVSAAAGEIDVFVNTTHPTTGPGKVFALPMFVTGFFPWWPMIWQIRQLKKRGYDLVLVSHALPVGTAAWVAQLMGGLPYIVLLHGLDLRLAVRSKRKSWLVSRILRSANRVLTNSQFVANEVRSFVPSVQPHVLTPGVEAMTFEDRATARQKCKLSPEAFVILVVTRLVPRKGIDQVLAALKDLPVPASCVIIGDGQDAERLGRLAWEYGVQERVTFLSHAADEERNRWYAAADVFVLPVRDEGNDVEGFGIVYLEAALAGLPIIAGKSGGASEAVEEGVTGVFVDPLDPAQIASALKNLYDHPAERERLGFAGRERALRDFQWKDRWLALQSWLH